MKICNKCSIDQPLVSYYIGVMDGISHKCKTCKSKFGVWSNMMQRCYNPKTKNYNSYGGRGIYVCKEWQTYSGMEQWIEDNWAKGLSIDKDILFKDNLLYSPKTCIFVTSLEQNAKVNRKVAKRKPQCSSLYHNVVWDKSRNKWMSYIRIGDEVKRIYLGRFDSQIEAAMYRDNYIIKNNLPNTRNFN